MALTYGFYNSIEGDRVYDAIQFGRIFDGIIKDGVYATYEKGMMVIASSNPGEVIIQPGRAWFNHTWSYNDANVIFEAPAPEVLLERIDALVLEINEELSARENSYKWVTGTPSSRPERPTLTNTSTIHQYPLCYVHRYPETTMIYTRDITNMIGTSECPFATGVLEGIDLDAWINQWDDEFHTWETTKKTQFEAWMLSQETAFTTWYNAFKDQMESDVQEVEDFVDYLKTVLDESTAIHLQEEIDDLRNEISSGSHITIATINPELYGRNVTITEAGGTVFTEKFDNTGIAVFKSVPYVGNLTISSTYGTQTAERVVNTPYYARYEFAIAFWAATVNIVGDPEMAGSSVTVKDSDDTIVGTVVLDSSATGVYTAIKPDTYKFTLTYGGETMEVTLSVTQETTYTVDLHAAGFRWQDWLEAGGVTGSYSSLDDVLADEVALRRLFTVHASVDYMAGINDENEDVEKIIVTDLAAKWINNRDYALDTLYANTIIADYMDEADKYFYGEWALVGQVPTMTSNTPPYGSLWASYYNTGYEAYRAFDDNSTDGWYAAGGSVPSDIGMHYIQYDFGKVVSGLKLAKIIFENSTSDPMVYRYQISASANGTDFDVIKSENALSLSGNKKVEITAEMNGDYRYIRFANARNTTASTTGVLNSFQVYSWGPKGNVPVMTSNTAPYGIASASSEYSSGWAAWGAFDRGGTMTNMWMSTAITNQYIRYKSVNPICVRAIDINDTDNASYGDTVKNFRVEGSNDGVNFTPIYTGIAENNHSPSKRFTFDNDDYYLYHQVYIIDEYNANQNIRGRFQFYGRELSVSVPTMATNTTPYGTASLESYVTGYEAYKAFDNNASTYARTASSADQHLQYDFVTPIKLEQVYILSTEADVRTPRLGQVLGSEDGTNFEEVYDFNNTIPTRNVPLVQNVENNKVFKSVRLVFRRKSTDTYDGSLTQVQFYGLDYSEKEFEEGSTKKWLYDHGVEVTQLYYDGTCVEKKPDEILMWSVAPNWSTWGSFVTENTIDLTPYSLFRAKVNEWYIPSGNSDAAPKFQIVDTKTSTQPISSLLISSNTNLPYNLALDISSINDSKCPKITSDSLPGNRLSITEAWLE